MAARLLKLLSAALVDSDADLLARFTATRDDGAFAGLVHRHGPAVYRTCRRLLGPGAADDAFQATFLILARRAGTIQKAGSVGSWLIGTAGRVARQMRSRERRERAELRLGEHPSPHADAGRTAELAELGTALHDELTQLPTVLRDPVVLCLVEGRTQEQAVAVLGGSVRTLRRRLERARAVLCARLERRGVVPAVAAALVTGLGSAVAVPPELIRRTVSEASEFLAGGAVTPAGVVANGVAGSMGKYKMVMAVAAATVLIGFGAVIRYSSASRSHTDHSPNPTAPPEQHEVARTTTAPPPREVAPNALTASVPDVPSDGASPRTPNFIVHAPDSELGRQIAYAAEAQRKALAKKWLGEELPQWEKPCAIKVDLTSPSRGATSFLFTAESNPPAVTSINMQVQGEMRAILNDVLPHQVTHTVLATYFGRPMPRWAEQGLAILTESETEQRNHDVRCRELLDAGRGIRLRKLFRLTEFPRDLIVLYCEGHSVARFLLTRKVSEPPPFLTKEPFLRKQLRGWGDPHRVLLLFIALGMNGNTEESWNHAAKTVYGFESVDALEEAWLVSLKMPPETVADRTSFAPETDPVRPMTPPNDPPVRPMTPPNAPPGTLPQQP